MAIQSVEDKKRTGPIADSSVNSSTFSIADFVGFKGGGRTRVDRSAMVQLWSQGTLKVYKRKPRSQVKGCGLKLR